MTNLRTPRYLKIYDIQALLKYIFVGKKRPRFIQLRKKPSCVVLARLSSYGAAAKQRDGANVHINENLELDFLFKNLTKCMDIPSVDISCITEESIEGIEKQDTAHLFSYSEFVKSQTEFDAGSFSSFIHPRKETPYFLVALDCEMMLTEGGTQLGRLTMLDHRGRVLYDKYVRPETQVLDYLEQYSGLNHYNTSAGISLRQLREEVLEYIGTNTYVLGHGLENDLSAINLYTGRVIDTAYLFLSSEGYKIKLCQLSKKYFNEAIQSGAHSSYEDALCCLKLLAYKIQQLRLLHTAGAALLDLGVPVHSADSLEAALRLCSQRSLIFLDAPLPGTTDIPASEGVFWLLFYQKDEKNYVAFRQR